MIADLLYEAKLSRRLSFVIMATPQLCRLNIKCGHDCARDGRINLLMCIIWLLRS